MKGAAAFQKSLRVNGPLSFDAMKCVGVGVSVGDKNMLSCEFVDMWEQQEESNGRAYEASCLARHLLA